MVRWLESVIWTGIIGGGLVAVYYFKDDILKIIDDIIKPSDGDGNGNGDGGPTPKPEPKPEPTPKPTPKPEPAPTGKQWYKANGAIVPLSKGRQDGESNRWNKNVIGWQNGFEVMGYLTVTGMQSGSHIGLKMGGPNHSGGRECCWWDGGLRRNGDAYLEIEYPHPTNKNRKILAKMGRNIDAGVLGIRWFNAKEGSGRRVMLWVDTSGKANAHKWTLMYSVLDKGQFMPTSYYDEVPNNQELEIRISDVSPSKIKWHTGPVSRKLQGSSSNLAQAYYVDMDTFDRITVPY